MDKLDIAKIFEPLKSVYPDEVIDDAVDDTATKLGITK